MPQKIKKTLTIQEIAIAKKLHTKGKNNQEIVGIINTKRVDPALHINCGRISEIINGQKGQDIQMATEEELQKFLLSPAPQEDTSPISDNTLSKLLKLKKNADNILDIDELSIFECKGNFSADERSLIKPLISFANNRGGYILYGIKDASWEILGLSSKKVDAFNSWDLEKLSGCILEFAGCGLSIEKRIYTINQKQIGIIYVYQAKKRPIILTKNEADFSSGQIYYRYLASNRLIGSVELDEIIEDRINSVISTTLSKHIENIIKNGIENTAILNLKTGEVEGKSGNFVIDETLLSKIQFIKEGEFVEKKGAPALKLMGNLQPITALTEIEIEKEIERSITIKDVVEAFVKQTMVSAPLEYIKTIALDTGKWIPIYYFIRKSKKNPTEIKQYLQGLTEIEGKTYPQKTIEMLDASNTPSFGRKREKTKMENIKQKTITGIYNKDEALSFLASVGELSKENLDLKYCLKLLQQIMSTFWIDKEIQTKTKYCCAYLDRLFFKQ